MHHTLASVDLLESIESEIIEVIGRVEVPLLVPHHLLEEVVSARLPLLSLQQQVVSRGNLVVLVVLNIGHCLAQVAVVRSDA